MSNPSGRAKQLVDIFLTENHRLPAYHDLPYIPGTDFRCAWGLFDKDDKPDQLGTLNLLTPSVVLEARQEIQTGTRCSLNWEMSNVKFPAFGRAGFKHKVIDHSHHGFIGHDDEVSCNTQLGTQWDGLLHVAHQETKLYYNNLRHEDVAALQGSRNGLDQVHKAGGICGRGVLIDYVSYARRHSIPLNPISRQIITIAKIEECAAEQGVVFKEGDILLIRSGFVKWHDEADDAAREKATSKNHTFIGVEASDESRAWHWNRRFSAVAGDTTAYEAWPPSKPMLHESLLSGFGMLIGEMWDMEDLARQCEQHARWSFFLTSAPMNVIGGIGSPANAIAIF